MNLPVVVATLLLPAAPPTTACEPLGIEAAQPVCEPVVMAPPVVPTLPPPSESGLQPIDGGHDIVVTARGAPPPGDPLQRVNAETFKAVQAIDDAVVGPVALVYEGGVPKPVRDGVGNALRNLGEPVNFLNFLLQFKFGKAAETAGRFAVNTTVGVGGLFDVARKKPFHLPYRPNGFANTLGYYGVKSGAYLYLPLVGPTTVRDMIGDGIDLLVLPVSVGKPFDRAYYSIPTTVVKELNDRVDRDAEIRRLRETSPDPYAETRTLYLEMRQREIDALHNRVAPAPEAPAATPSVPEKTGEAPAATPPE